VKCVTNLPSQNFDFTKVRGGSVLEKSIHRHKIKKGFWKTKSEAGNIELEKDAGQNKQKIIVN